MTVDATAERVLCRVEDIADGQSRGFHPQGNDDRLFAVRRGASVYVYMNTCPHNWRPLEYAKDRFLSADGAEIMCYAHGAHFTIESGVCVSGPCEGDRLIAVPARVDDGVVIISSELPAAPAE
jgi:nitrite reductase/ring-hydroxylating ferredoxin subunit